MAECEEMAEKLSAFMDGELEAEEVSALREHLRTCPACRNLEEGFGAVDRLVGRAVSRPSEALEGRIRAALNQPRPNRGIRRLLQISAAALVLIAASLVILVTGDRADASRLAVPAAALEAMNLQVLEDQQALLKTLEWDLRAMKLMVSSPELEEGKAKQLLDEIDLLLAKVKRLESEEDIR